MSVPTTLLVFCHAREVTGYCPAGVQGTILGIVFDLSALPYFLRPFPSPYQAGLPGRLVLVGSDCTSWRGAKSRGFNASLIGEAGQSQKWCFGQAFQSERPSEGGLETKASSSVKEAS